MITLARFMFGPFGILPPRWFARFTPLTDVDAVQRQARAALTSVQATTARRRPGATLDPAALYAERNRPRAELTAGERRDLEGARERIDRVLQGEEDGQGDTGAAARQPSSLTELARERYGRIA